MKPFKLHNGEMYFEDKGTGSPLLFLHAGIADSRMWDPQVETFSKDFRTLRCDLRGYGNSILPDGKFSCTEDVLTLVKTLDLGRTWLIGASFGAKVAVDCYLSDKDLIRGLVLVAPVVSGFQPSEEIEEFDQQEEALLDSGNIAEATELNLRMWVDGPFRNSEAVPEELRRKVYEMQFQSFSQPEPEHVSVRQMLPPAIERLEEINVPVLIVAGDKDVPSFVGLSEQIADRIPGAKRVVIPDAAHMLNMEVPEKFNQIVFDYISNHG